MKKIAAMLCAAVMLIFLAPTAGLRAYAAGPQIKTTLTDGMIQKSSRRNFDVWARNSKGEKINAAVTFNGEKLIPTWDDGEKASYTLEFQKQGDNVVEISASSDGGRKKKLTYHIDYRRTAEGEPVGSAVCSVEMFTLGGGYLIYPCEMPIYEGENAAQLLLRMLSENGLCGYYNGSPDSAFYLAYISGGDDLPQKYNGYTNSGRAASPREITLSPKIPAALDAKLKKDMSFYDAGDYANWDGYLGEFVISNGSGWMYCVNNNFPNVGFSDCYLCDGDVMRVQFTLSYGADIGGLGSVGTLIPGTDKQPSSGYFAAADKDELTRAICRARSSGLLDRANVARAYEKALKAAEALDCSDEDSLSAAKALNTALAAPDDIQDIQKVTSTTAAATSAASRPHKTSAGAAGTIKTSFVTTTARRDIADDPTAGDNSPKNSTKTTTAKSVSGSVQGGADTQKTYSAKPEGTNTDEKAALTSMQGEDTKPLTSAAENITEDTRRESGEISRQKEDTEQKVSAENVIRKADKNEPDGGSGGAVTIVIAAVGAVVIIGGVSVIVIRKRRENISHKD